ncbi:uncharacterized protein LOC133179468 [Saccostrea echinata]|uniref:uncharacterized protein LOC133179468 n=1 Tax=Saccostrea echinata TaxID=191078 RepID=UPI002A831780|nr:uncharacterized protein LOC133179468 [Saccostrea echinata]
MYVKYHQAVILLIVFSLSYITGHSCNSSAPEIQGNITVKYTIRNKLVEPKFEYERNVTSYAGQPFIRFMEQAADDDKIYRFSSKYYGSLGYFIEKLGMDREYVPGLTYWQFLKAPSTILPVGVSTYVPMDGDHLIFDYVLQGNCSSYSPQHRSSGKASPLSCGHWAAAGVCLVITYLYFIV